MDLEWRKTSRNKARISELQNIYHKEIDHSLKEVQVPPSLWRLSVPDGFPSLWLKPERYSLLPPIMGHTEHLSFALGKAGLRWLSAKLFFFFWLCWVFVAVCRLSLVVVSRGYSSLWSAGFSLRWLPLLWSVSSRHAGFSSCGSWALEHRLSSCGTQA